MTKVIKLLIAILISFLLAVTSSLISLFVLLNIVDLHDIFSILFLIVAIVFVIFLFNFQKSYIVATSKRNYDLLFKNQDGVVKSSYTIEKLLDNLTNMQGYLLYLDDQNVSVYYSFVDNYIKRQRKVLIIFIKIKNSLLALNSKELAIITNNLEKSLEKKHKYKQRVIYQIKQEINLENIKEANNIIYIQNRHFGVVLINLLYEQNEFYFLHSKKYAPNALYRFATDYILKLLGVK